MLHEFQLYVLTATKTQQQTLPIIFWNINEWFYRIKSKSVKWPGTKSYTLQLYDWYANQIMAANFSDDFLYSVASLMLICHAWDCSCLRFSSRNLKLFLDGFCRMFQNFPRNPFQGLFVYRIRKKMPELKKIYDMIHWIVLETVAELLLQLYLYAQV